MRAAGRLAPHSEREPGRRVAQAVGGGVACPRPRPRPERPRMRGVRRRGGPMRQSRLGRALFPPRRLPPGRPAAQGRALQAGIPTRRPPAALALTRVGAGTGVAKGHSTCAACTTARAPRRRRRLWRRSVDGLRMARALLVVDAAAVAAGKLKEDAGAGRGRPGGRPAGPAWPRGARRLEGGVNRRGLLPSACTARSPF